MYIIAIGWLYVVVLMALTETSVVAGIATLVFYGLVPVGILIYLGGAKGRRRRRLAAEMAAREQTAPDANADEAKEPKEPG